MNTLAFLSLLVTQLAVILLVIEVWALKRELKATDKLLLLIAEHEMKKDMKEKAEQLLDLITEDNDKKSTANGKNKLKSFSKTI